MSRTRIVPGRFAAIVGLYVFLSGCSIAPFQNDTSIQSSLEQRAVQQTQGEFTVSASVPSVKEARALFGIPMHRRDIQPVWLKIVNNGANRARFAPYSVDPEYFPPHEVAYMHRKKFSKQGHADLEAFLVTQSLPRQIAPGETVSGYVFTHSTIGTKAFNVDIHDTRSEGKNEHFTFFINVPGFVPDHAEVNFSELYAATEIRELDRDEFRAELQQIPCCSVDRSGKSMGRPVEVFLVAEGNDLLQVFLRSGWLETSYKRDDKYLNGCHYFYGRCPDVILKKGRDRTSERLEIAGWLTPLRFEDKPVWAVQTRHAIGRRFDIGEYFLNVRLDPHADQGRNFLFQDLWYSQSLIEFGWSRSGMEVDKESPKSDFTGNIWFSDGYRLVARISGDPVSMGAVQSLAWDIIIDPPEGDEP